MKPSLPLISMYTVAERVGMGWYSMGIELLERGGSVVVFQGKVRNSGFLLSTVTELEQPLTRSLYFPLHHCFTSPRNSIT